MCLGVEYASDVLLLGLNSRSEWLSSMVLPNDVGRVPCSKEGQIVPFFKKDLKIANGIIRIAVHQRIDDTMAKRKGTKNNE